MGEYRPQLVQEVCDRQAPAETAEEYEQNQPRTLGENRLRVHRRRINDLETHYPGGIRLVRQLRAAETVHQRLILAVGDVVVAIETLILRLHLRRGVDKLA